MSIRNSLVNTLLRCLLQNDYEERSGDLEEFRRAISLEQGPLKARLWMAGQITNLGWKALTTYLQWSLIMMSNALKTAFRSARSQKYYTVINLLGLGLGIAFCLLTLIWTEHEWGWDSFHAHAKRLHKIYSVESMANSQIISFNASYYPLKTLIENDIPEVEAAARVQVEGHISLQNGDSRLNAQHICFADPDFFTLFSFEVLSGNPANLLTDAQSIVLTQKSARLLFADEDPIGQKVHVAGQLDLLVTGIVADVPAKSSLNFDAIVPFRLQFAPACQVPEHWGGNPFETWILTRPDADLTGLGDKITALVKKHHNLPNVDKRFHLDALSRQHLYLPNGKGLHRILRMLALSSLLVLFIACTNFINLGTARASTRTREIGLRKTLGATRNSLVSKYMSEAFAMAGGATLLALLLIWMALPEFSRLIGRPLQMSSILNPVILLGLILTFFSTGLISGIYPAVILASFTPGQALQGRGTLNRGKNPLRKLLVVVQFSLTMLAIIALSTVHGQIDYIKQKDLGFDTHNLLVINLPPDIKNQHQSIKTQVMMLPEIESVSMGLQSPSNIGSTVTNVQWPGKTDGQAMQFYWDVVGYDYFETLGLNITEGRGFDEAFNDMAGHGFILNQTAARLMAMDSPLGQTISVMGNSGPVVGIVEDFHFQPLTEAIAPFIYWADDAWPGLMFIRTGDGQSSAARKKIKEVLSRFSPDANISVPNFDSVLFNSNYQKEQKMSAIFKWLTGLALLLSTMGLMGLSSFIISRKTREMGIRKVLGATVPGLTIHLVKDFSRWVLVAIALSMPLGWLLARSILAPYAYRMPLTPALFMLSALLAMVTAWIAVSVQSVRAALTNPARTLRSE